MIKLILSFLVILGTVGCATNMPPPNFAPTNVGIIQKKAPADLRTISVTIAQPQEQIGKKVNLGQQALWYAAWGDIPGHWKNALENALIRANAFDVSSTKKVNVLVKVLQYSQPALSLTFPTIVSAQYDIMDLATGAIVFTTTVETTGKTETSHAFLGATRALESQNRAVQMNIIQFIQQLEGADISKPVFPGRKSTVTP